MIKSKFLVLLMFIFLINGVALATDNNEQSLIIKFKSGETGGKLLFNDINWPECFEHQIKVANDGLGRFVLVVSNDTATYQLPKWLKKQPGTDGINPELLNTTSDGGLNVQRYKVGINWLIFKGLKRLDIQYIPVDTNEVFIKIYYEAYPVFKNKIDNAYINKLPLPSLAAPSVINNNFSSHWSFGIGVGAFSSPEAKLSPRFIIEGCYDSVFVLRFHYGQTTNFYRYVNGYKFSTFDRGFGLDLIYYFKKTLPIGILAGAFQDQNIVNKYPQISEFLNEGEKSLHTDRGIKLGLSLRFNIIGLKFSGFAATTVNYEKLLNQSIKNNTEKRFGITLSKVWR